MDLPAKMVELHLCLDRAGIPHAFGGALALAWCTRRARGTIDIDLNVFVPVDDVDRVLAALPAGVEHSDADAQIATRDGQIRLMWDRTPVDLFWNTTEFHEAAAARARVEEFAGASLPFLGCTDLAVFKALFNRTKDWADIEEMVEVGSLDVDRVLGTLVRYLGGDDARVERLRRVAAVS